MKTSQLKSRYLSFLSLISISIFFILFSSNVLAGNNFNAYSNQASVSSCTCIPIKTSISLTNLGDKTDSYSLYSSGSNAEWSTYTPPSLILRPGETGTVSHFVNPLCATSGSFDLKTYIESSSGQTKTLTQNVDLKNCINLEVYSVNSNQSSCACTKKQYDFVVKNIGAYVETYDFSISPNENSASYVPSIMLKPGASAVYSVIISPSCDKMGVEQYSLNVLARTSKLLAVSPFVYNAKNCNDFSIYESKKNNQQVCVNDKSNSYVTVENLGINDNSYTATLYAPSWVTLSQNKSFVKAGKTADFKLDILPPIGSEGRKEIFRPYTLRLDVTDENAKISKSINFQINATQCYGVDIKPELYEQTICCSQNKAGIIVKNTGSVEEEILLESSSLYDWITLSKHSVSLMPGEEKYVSMNINAPCSTQSYDVIINATVENHPEISEYSSTRLNVLSKQSCYELKTDVKKAYIELGQNLTSVNVSVKNTGIKQGIYVLSLSDVPTWVKLDTSYLMLNSSSSGDITLLVFPNESTSSGKYLVGIKFNLVNDNATYTLPFTVVFKKPVDVIGILLSFIEKYLFHIILILSLIIIIWILNKIYVYYKTKEITKKILLEQEKASEQARLDAMTPMERRAEKRRLISEQKKAQKLAMQEIAQKKKSDIRFLRFIRFAGIVLVVFMALLLLYSSLKGKYSPAHSQTTVLEDVKLMMTDLKDMVIKPFSNPSNISVGVGNTSVSE